MSKHEVCLIGVIVLGIFLHIILWRQVIVGVFKLLFSSPKPRDNNGH